MPALLQTTLKVDVVLVQVSPPDASGQHSLGLANDWLMAALQQARVVIAEVNPHVPRTCGERTLHADQIDLRVPAQFAPLEVTKPSPPSAVDGQIAQHVAALVDDGATLQLGLGGVTDAVLALLRDRRDLGVHSGIIGDSVADLMAAGVITNARKSIDRGMTVAGLLIGSQRLYRFAHGNAAIQLRGTAYVHNAGVLRSIDQFVAINSAIEVDLTGQVNAEVANGLYVGAVGGAPDFLRAAQLSRGGIPIIAFASTAGLRSRIVANLSGPVTTARCDAGVFATEHGVADLRGLTHKQCTQRLLDIAAPEHRAELARLAAGA